MAKKIVPQGAKLEACENATVRPTPRSRAKSTPKPRPTGGRASERRAVSLYAAGSELTGLMTEQCRAGTGISTFYSGSRAQFVAAGLTNDLFPSGKKSVSFRVDPGSCWFGGEVDAHLSSQEDGYELEIQWGHRGPYICAHPSLRTIARVMVDRLWNLTKLDIGSMSAEVPLERLAGFKEAYGEIRPGNRLEFGPEFLRTLRNTVYTTLWHTILNGEVLPIKADETSVDAAKADSDFQKLLKSVVTE